MRKYMDNNFLSQLYVLLACFSIASIGGIAALLRTSRPITVRLLFTAFLYSGLFGLVIGLLWYHQLATNLFFLVGISGLAGLGGVSVIDLALQLVLKGINVKVSLSADNDVENLKSAEKSNKLELPKLTNNVQPSNTDKTNESDQKLSDSASKTTEDLSRLD